MRLVFLDWNQGDLAAVVDVCDFHLDLIADVDDVLDLLDALVAAELRDVDEAIAAWGQGDKRAEGYGLNDGA